MKGVYIYWSLKNVEEEYEIGVSKKILSQYRLFKEGISEDFEIVNVKTEKKYNKILTFFMHFFSKKMYNFVSITEKKYDCIYIRRLCPNNYAVISFLKTTKRRYPSCKIIYEIPTFPYDKEQYWVINKLRLFVDKVYRMKLHKYIDRIATLTDDKEIFNCKTLKITNGVDCNSIPLSKKEKFDDKQINMVAVAQFAFWHGYDRLIEGMALAKKSNIYLHLVGDGRELQKYKQLVEKYKLENNVKFYGALSGDNLTDVIDKGDIMISSLGCHRKNLFLSSELKSREYLCRGLPIISSTKIDIIPNNFEYCFRVPEDESPIDVEKVVEYVRLIYENKDRKEIAKEIRKFAEENCCMEKSMKSVVDYLRYK